MITLRITAFIVHFNAGTYIIEGKFISYDELIIKMQIPLFYVVLN